VGTQPPGAAVGRDEELVFYQAVEDGFCRLRGTPFLFSPRDFHLLQRWWKDGIPLAAVMAGLSEVFARREERGEGPVSSLSYCRHAVNRHAKRLAASRVGSQSDRVECDPGPRLTELNSSILKAAERWNDAPVLARALNDLAAAVASLPATAAPAELDATLAQLELGILAGMWELIPEELQNSLEEELEGQMRGLDLEGEVGCRTRSAVRMRRLREAVGLPRLELG